MDEQTSATHGVRAWTPAIGVGQDSSTLGLLLSTVSVAQNTDQHMTSLQASTVGQDQLQSNETDIQTEEIRHSLQEVSLNDAETETFRHTLNLLAGERSPQAVTLIKTQNVGYTGAAESEKNCQKYLKIKIDNAKRIFVKTKAYELIKENLDFNNHVTILGAPGAGKTTVSLVLLHEYRQKGYDVHFVDTLDKFIFEKQIDSKNPTILVLDDVFGQTGVRDNVGYQKVFDSIESYWEHQQARGKPKKRNSTQTDPHEEKYDQSENEMNLKVVFTSRTSISNEIHNKTGKYKYTLLKQSTVIDLTNTVPLTTEEKEKILVHHLKENKMQLSDKDILAIANGASSNLGFPYMCKLFTTVKHFQNSPKDFFLKPMAYLVNTMENIMEPRETQDSMAAVDSKAAVVLMVLMVVYDGSLNLANISTTRTKKTSGFEDHLQIVKEYVSFSDCPSFVKTVGKAARNLTGTYFVNESGELTFSHPAIYDALSFIIGRNDADFVLNHCSMRFIHEKVHVPSSHQEKVQMADEYEFIINLTPNYYDVFIKRLANELKALNFSLVLSHKGLGISCIFDGLFNTLLQENAIEGILHKGDQHYGRSFLFWTTFAISDFVTYKSFQLTSFDLKEIAEGVLGCCLSGNKDALKVLISKSPSILKVINTMPIKDILDIETGTKAVLQTLSTASDTKNRNVLKEANCSIHGDPNDKLLHIASANAHVEVVKMLLDNGGDINVKGGLGRTPLMYASRGGHSNLVRMLLEHEADVSVCDEESATCFHLATRGGHKAVLEVFVGNGMDINAKGEHDRTPLFYACRYGYSDVVELLLAHGGDTNLTCCGDNCLHRACVGGHLDIIKKLLNYGMQINTEGQHKKTPLMYACRRGHLKVVDFLIKEGAKVDLLDANGGTCLHLAAHAGEIELIKYLINLDFHPNAKDKRGKTSVSTAVYLGHVEMVKFLFDYCQKNFGRDELSELFRLDLPCITGNTQMVDLLLDLNVEVNRKGSWKRTPLMRACQNSYTEIVDILLKAGADVFAVDEAGAMCIHLACQAGYVNLVETLMDNGCDINVQGQNNWTPVMYACRYCNRELFDLLIQRGADTSFLDVKRGNCIHLLCMGKKCSVSILSKLIELGVEFDALDKFHKTPLLYAISNGHMECFELLCEKRADIAITDLKGANVFHFACQGGHLDIVLHLLALGLFDINGRENQGWTPLMYSCHSKSGNLDLIKLLLERGADLSLTDNFGANCLHHACQSGYAEIVQKLLHVTPNLHNQDQKKWTPVMYACRYGHRKILDVLLNYIHRVSLTECDKNGSSCLHLACQGGQVDVVTKLLDLDLDINRTGQHGRTPAMYACRSGNMDVFQLLWQKGANTKCTNNFGGNCLHVSCMGKEDNVDVVEKLVEMEFSINSTDVHMKTPIMYACKNGHSKVVEFLLSKGANVAITDIKGASCYKLALNGGHTHLANRLLEVMHA